MKRGILLITLLAAAPAGCGQERGGEIQAGHAPAQDEKAAPPTATRDEVLALLRAAGYDPQTRETPRFSGDMERGLAAVPEPPVSHFMLGVDGEGMIAFEFATVALARSMARTQEDGFPYRNWFFGGAVTMELTGGMQKALGE